MTESVGVRRFLRGCAVLVLVVVVLLGIGYLAHGLYGTAQVGRAKEQAVDDLAAALPGATQEAAQDRDEVRAVTSTRWGRPAYSWQDLSCELTTRDAGWIVQSHAQECRLLSVDLFPLTEAEAEAAERDASGASGRRCAGDPLATLLPAASSTTELPSGSVERGPTDALVTASPAAVGCPDGILGPSRSGAGRLLTGSRPVSLDQEPGWAVVTVRTDVITSELGCSPWVPLVCSAPVDEPVLGGRLWS